MKHTQYYGDKYPEFMNDQFKPAEVQPQLERYVTRRNKWGNFLDCIAFAGLVLTTLLLWGIFG